MSDEKLVTSNRQARHEYFLEVFFEAGLALTGTEVKALRAGRANLQDAFCVFEDGSLLLRGLHISPYEHGGYVNHEPTRARRLLLKKEELRKLSKAVDQKGYTIVPTRLYFKGSYAKVEVALARGKKQHDKRDTIAERDTQRRLDRARRGDTAE